MRQRLVWTYACLLVAASFGCGSLKEAGPDASSDAEVGLSDSPDSGVGDAGGGPPTEQLCGVGAACTVSSECAVGWLCQQELSQSFDVEGYPEGLVSLPLFPGGACAPLPAQPYSEESCDPFVAPGADGCGACGACAPVAFADQVNLACRERCEPSGVASGCARDGYTCDFRWHVCVEGCRTDAECRIAAVDSNGDGLADSNVYDAASPAWCNLATGRCDHPGRAHALAGEACSDDLDCEADGVCLAASSRRGDYSWPGGYCTKLGCDLSGRACAGPGTVCGSVRSLYGALDPTDRPRRLLDEQPLCLRTCRLGAELEAHRLGSGGHGEGCRPGYRCAWNGVDGDAADNGFCSGGNYNDISENNVGEPCAADSDCFSPFGHGLCLEFVGAQQASTWRCSVLDCAAPGLPADICGPHAICASLTRDDSFSACLATCDSAIDCPEGFACADDGDPTTPNVCDRRCLDHEECLSTEYCDFDMGSCLPEAE